MLRAVVLGVGSDAELSNNGELVPTLSVSFHLAVNRRLCCRKLLDDCRRFSVFRGGGECHIIYHIFSARKEKGEAKGIEPWS